MKKLLALALLLLSSTASAQTVGFVRGAHSWNDVEVPTMEVEQVSFSEFAIGIGNRYESLDIMVGAGLQYVDPYALGALFFLQGRRWLSEGSFSSSIFIEQGWHASNSEWTETMLYTGIGISAGISIGSGHLNFEPAIRIRYKEGIQPVIGISLTSVGK